MNQVLMRGTLSPNMGSTTSYKEQGRTRQSFPVRAVVKPASSSRLSGNNRIPSSISLKKNMGAR